MGLLNDSFLFKPNCRYGHGDLDKVNNRVGYPNSFGLVGSHFDENGKPHPAGVLAVDVFECKTCGYTELFERRPS